MVYKDRLVLVLELLGGDTTIAESQEVVDIVSEERMDAQSAREAQLV